MNELIKKLLDECRELISTINALLEKDEATEREVRKIPVSMIEVRLDLLEADNSNDNKYSLESIRKSLFQLLQENINRQEFKLAVENATRVYEMKNNSVEIVSHQLKLRTDFQNLYKKIKKANPNKFVNEVPALADGLFALTEIDECERAKLRLMNMLTPQSHTKQQKSCCFFLFSTKAKQSVQEERISKATCTKIDDLNIQVNRLHGKLLLAYAEASIFKFETRESAPKSSASSYGYTIT